MGTDLTRIGEKARKDPELVFTSLYHHITDIDNLRASYDKLLAHKASGIDGVTKEEYGKHLEENLRDLSSRLKRMGYRLVRFSSRLNEARSLQNNWQYELKRPFQGGADDPPSTTHGDVVDGPLKCLTATTSIVASILERAIQSPERSAVQSFFGSREVVDRSTSWRSQFLDFLNDPAVDQCRNCVRSSSQRTACASR